LIAKEERQQKDLQYAKSQVAKLKEKLADAIDRYGVNIQDDLHDDLCSILETANLSPVQALFFEQQLKAVGQKNARSRRWHPTLIRFALLLKTTSTAAYRAVQDSGIIVLPSERLLYEYSNAVDPEAGCTISLKGIVQRKGPVALPSSGRNRTIWLSRVYASPEPFLIAGNFGVVVKVLNYHPTGDSDRGSSPVGPKIFLSGKKGKKKSRVTSLPFLFPTKSCQIAVSLSPASHLKWNQGKESFLWTRTKQFGRSIRCTPHL